MKKNNQSIPIKQKEIIELTIEKMASSGDGLCKYKGYTLFVPESVPGDKIKARVSKITPRFAVCTKIESLEASNDRVSPECKVFDKCGGCQLQHISYESQEKFKTEVVTDAIERIGGLKLPENTEFISASHHFNYRNKGIFPVAKIKKTFISGFYEKGSHNIISVKNCPVMLEAINEIKGTVFKLIIQHNISIYNENNHSGFLKKIIVRGSATENEFLVGLITTKGEVSKEFVKDIQHIMGDFKITGIIQNINPDKTNIILGKENKLLWGRRFFNEKIGKISFRLSLSSFFQVNSYQVEKLNDAILSLLKNVTAPVLDAYCGIGSISLWLANAGKQVTGVEEHENAIVDAKESAKYNGIDCSFYAETIEDFIKKGDLKNFGAVVLDPPRKGCSPEVVAALVLLRPEKVVYVSCNPATLARDLKKFNEAGYEIKKVRIVDMFPQTVHVETVVLLTL